MSPISEAGYFLFEVIFDLLTWLFLLRLLLQLARADFYNPISQFIVKATSPVITPLRRVIPPLGSLDTASVVILIALGVLKFATLQLLTVGALGNPLGLLVLGLGNLISVTLTFYLFVVFILVILSWIAPYQNNPAQILLSQLAAPILRRAQGIIPPISGLDLSPILVLVGIQLLQILLAKPVMQIGASML